MIKIAFTDFWPNFDPNNNFFINIIKYIKGENEVEVTHLNEADVLIYTCFGNNHNNFKNGPKIYYTGENIRPNFNECDYSMTFDFNDYDNRNIRVPLWLLQIDWFNKNNSSGNPNFTIPLNLINNNAFTKTSKTKFSVMINNHFANRRDEFCKTIKQYKPVDCYGKPFNNWFYGENKKYQILSEYKFNICFENTNYSGYCTEKIFHAKTAGCIPIYHGHEDAKKDFNENCFINLTNFNTINEFCNKVIEIDKSKELYNSYVNEKIFKLDKTLDDLNYIANFLNKII